MIRSLSILTAVAVAFVFATSANALVIDQLQVIHTNGDPDGAADWHLAEVEAFEFGTGINRAEQSQGGVASYPTGVDGGIQDTPGDTSGSTFGTVPGDANDGNTDGSFGNGSVWHSEVQGEITIPDVFQIDLAGAFDITGVVLHGRTDCCGGRDDDLTVVGLLNGQVVFSEFAGIVDGSSSRVAIIPHVPEPASIALLGMAGLGLIKRRRRVA